MNIKKILEKKLPNSDLSDIWFNSIDSAQKTVNSNFLSDKDLEIIILNSNTIDSFNNLIIDINKAFLNTNIGNENIDINSQINELNLNDNLEIFWFF